VLVFMTGRLSLGSWCHWWPGIPAWYRWHLWSGSQGEEILHWHCELENTEERNGNDRIPSRWNEWVLLWPLRICLLKHVVY